MRTLTLHGHEPRNLEGKGQKVKRSSDTITAEQGTDPGSKGCVGVLLLAGHSALQRMGCLHGERKYLYHCMYRED